MMITELYVKNYILIPELRLAFSAGMTVLTGETGAGKSIIVGALNLIFGKVAAGQVAHNPEQDVYLEITCSHCANNRLLCDFLEDNGINSEDGELVIAREICPNGKTTSYLNGRKTGLSLLRDLHDLLIDFHHQRDQQKLLQSSYQLDLTDQYGKLQLYKKQFQDCLAEFRKLRAEMNRLLAVEEQNRQLADLYSFQFEELQAADLNADEDTELQQEFELLSHSAEIISLSQTLYGTFYEQENSIYDLFSGAQTQILHYTELSSKLEELGNKFSAGLDLVQEISNQLRQLPDTVASDPERLNNLKSRLDQINGLKTKYKLSSIAELLLYKDKIYQVLRTQQSNTEAIQSLANQIDKTFILLISLADLLSAKRIETAQTLSADIQNNIKQLSMPDARLEIQIDKKTKDKILISEVDTFFTESGQDTIEFLFSANPGSPMLPLKAVVSGGELSRILLAAKRCLAEVIPAKTVILDEIDTGIGGKTAGALAEFIYKLAAQHQVICITHLAKIAAVADAHCLIEKNASVQNTEVNVFALNADQRINEIARMLSGHISDSSIEHAKELLRIDKGYM
jgi:DNA repair protein RecN (Recombination protein N)